MRDYPINRSSFNEQIKVQVNKMVNSENLKTLRSYVIDSSNFHWELTTFFNLKRKSLDDLIRLAIWSWYAPEEIKFLLQEDIKEVSKNLSFEDKIILEIILLSKTEMLIYLQETKLWHSRDFFGNILDQRVNLLGSLKLFFRNKKIVKSQRKRGYDDHGSRVEDHQKLPKFDWSLIEAQNEIELRRETHICTLQFISGFLS